MIATSVLIGLMLCLQADPPTTTAPAPRVILPDESGYQPGPGDGEGHVRVTPRLVRSANPVKMKFEYQSGPSGIRVGGGVACLVSAFWGWTTPQIRDPDRPGYVTVTCSEPDVRLEVNVHAESRAIYARIADRPLPPGARLTFSYAGWSDRYAERDERFFFRVDGDGDGFYVALQEQPRFDVQAKEARQIVCFGPGHAYVGQPFEISVAVLDRAGNRAVGVTGPLKLNVTGSAVELPSSISFTRRQQAAQRVTVKPLETGIVLIEVTDPSGKLPTTVANPVLVRAAQQETRRLYWADLHGHSNLSDGTGRPEDYLAYAREVTRLDVVALTDHDRWGYQALRDHADMWQRVLAATRAANQPGRFLAIPGYEWTNWTWGHMHVLFERESQARIVAWNDPEGLDPAALRRALQGVSSIAIPHHPGGSIMPFHWPSIRDTDIRVAEISSVHGVSEYVGHPGSVERPFEAGMLQSALAAGHRVALIGSGDTHDGHPGQRPDVGTAGLAGIYATELTRAAIFEALRERRVYATTGCRAVLRFQLSGHPMGSEVPWPDRQRPRELKVQVFGDAPLESVEIIRNNEVASLHVPSGLLASLDWQDSSEATAGDYYYVRARQRDGHWVYSSPIWLE